MKVYMGKPKSFMYRARLVEFFFPKMDHEKVDKILRYIPKWPFDLWNQLFYRDQPKQKIQIDYWDTWSMDMTLGPIILPMLKQLKTTKHGSPYVDDEDIPVEMRLTKREKKVHEEGHWNKRLKASKEEQEAADNKFHARWDWVMDEMIWAFEQIVDPDEGRSQYYVPYESYEEAKKDRLIVTELQEDGTKIQKELFPEHGPEYRIQRGKFDKELHAVWQKRKSNGLMLFGKYFEALWD